MHHISKTPWVIFQALSVSIMFKEMSLLDNTIFVRYLIIVVWRRLGLVAASVATKYVVTHPQLSHNLSFFVDLPSKKAISGFPNNKIAYDIRPVLNLHSFW